MNGLVLLGVTLVAGTLLGLVLRRRDGRWRAAKAKARRGRASRVDFGEPLGERATLVQFSTAFCAPCRATRRVLGEVAGMVPGVRHIEIDAESRLDLVRTFDVLRTPTTLILDSSGNIVKRASGLPRKADVIAALGLAVLPNVDTTSQHADGK
ncbi:thioredoxin family protein [Acrocarpospora sp. B8E8]|uniref:TlpA family protein disulfide reductase n=1 Tax=Acrocarpospora sp. B8E8 TaxID=3153572 RepID=UPI00325D530B